MALLHELGLGRAWSQHNDIVDGSWNFTHKEPGCGAAGQRQDWVCGVVWDRYTLQIHQHIHSDKACPLASWEALVLDPGQGWSQWRFKMGMDVTGT